MDELSVRCPAFKSVSALTEEVYKVLVTVKNRETRISDRSVYRDVDARVKDITDYNKVVIRELGIDQRIAYHYGVNLKSPSFKVEQPIFSIVGTFFIYHIEEAGRSGCWC